MTPADPLSAAEAAVDAGDEPARSALLATALAEERTKVRSLQEELQAHKAAAAGLGGEGELAGAGARDVRLSEAGGEAFCGLGGTARDL